ncbi:MAG: hypothetical protein JOZ53_14315 [Planctomycetaceae bacterium]|nr:hypothetical protein [Planctomycetaceae bacterium]
MLGRIVSGGQTEADQAGGRAARACRSATSGGRPCGVRTEGGPRPDGADLYGARELPTGGIYRADRRPRAGQRRHARDSDTTRGCGAVSTPGARATIEAGHQGSRSCRRIEQGSTRPAHGAAGSGAHQIRLLHVAGHRESKPPGIGAGGERFLADVIRR